MVDTRTRQTSIPAQDYGYPASCGAVKRYGSWTTLNRFEEVVSFRGKHQYLRIGNKRRRVFHPFRRYKQTVSALENPWDWCPNTGKLYMRSDGNLSAFYTLRACNDKDYWSGTSYNSNADWPIIGEEQLAELGVEHREFIKRDLFIKANEPRYNSAVFLAELDETLVSFNKLLLGTFKGLFKKGEALKSAKHFAKNPQDLWLWFRYALLPAMLDAEDLIEAMKPQEKIDRVQDGSQFETTVTGTFRQHGWLRSGTYHDLEVPFKSDVYIGCGGAIDMYSRFDPHPWGTSAHDFLSGAWERKWLSFVIDWFINVGDWLSSLREIEISYAQQYCTYAVRSITELKPGDDVYFTGENPIVYNFLQDRIVDFEPPRFPLIDKRWANVLRTIDAISLTIGMLKGILKRRA